MKRLSNLDDQNRFSGNLRHYHRSRTQHERSWDEWIDGHAARPKQIRKWLKAGFVITAVLALAAILVGLFIEMS